MASEFSVQRHNDSFVAAWEKRALVAIARRLPGTVTPNALTALGVSGAFVVLAGYCLSAVDIQFLWLANLGLLINWLGDSLDGTVARVRGIERPKFGFFLDQTIDLISNLVMALGVGLSPWVRLDVALLFLAIYHMLAMYVLIYSTVRGEFHMDVAGFGPTEVRLGIVAMNIAILAFGAGAFVINGMLFSWCDIMLCTVFVGLLGLFIFEIVSKAREIVD